MIPASYLFQDVYDQHFGRIAQPRPVPRVLRLPAIAQWVAAGAVIFGAVASIA